MQPVGQFDKDYPHIVHHCQEHFTQIFGLLLFFLHGSAVLVVRGLPLDFAQLGNTVYQAGDFLAKFFMDFV